MSRLFSTRFNYEIAPALSKIGQVYLIKSKRKVKDVEVHGQMEFKCTAV